MPKVMLPPMWAVARAAICRPLHLSMRRDWERGVLDMRNKAFTHLHAAGWSPRTHKSWLKVFKDCPVLFHKPWERRRAYQCSHPLMCPFCYARRHVAKAVRYVEAAAKRRPTLRLLAFRSVQRFSAGISGWSTDVLESFGLEVRKWLLLYRRYEVDQFSTAIGAVLHQVEVHDDWIDVSRGGLLLVNRKHGPRHQERYDYLNSSFVCDAKAIVGFGPLVFPYPAANLTADPETLMGVMDVLTNVRMLSTYGGR